METAALLRRQWIENLMAQPTVSVADTAMKLWEPVATEIIAIIGESGFSSIYTRSVSLSQSSYPWLQASALAPRAGDQLAELKTSLQGQAPAHASDANRLLLITFTNTLAALIGEPLMGRILRSAWGSGAASATKESKNGYENR